MPQNRPVFEYVDRIGVFPYGVEGVLRAEMFPYITQDVSIMFSVCMRFLMMIAIDPN